MLTTHISSKGQVVIPKAIREEHHWGTGVELVIEDHQDHIILKPIKPFKTDEIDEILGCSGYKGPAKSLKEMDDAIAKGIAERW